jgi:hypothetical protein
MKNIDITMNYTGSQQPPFSDGAPPKFAIRLFFARRTINKQAI